MAVTVTTITGIDATHFQRGEPAFLAAPIPTAARWTDTGNPTAASKNDAAFPVQAAYDGHMGSITRPNAAQQTWWFTATLPSPNIVTAIFLGLRTTAMNGASCTTTVYVSDTTTDAGDVAITGAFDADHFGAGAAKRLGAAMLQVSGDSGTTQRKFSGVAYIKIKFDAGAGKTCRPQITELIAGQLRQLDRLPLHPYSQYALDTRVDSHLAANGAESVVVHYAGARNLEGVEWQFDADMRDRIVSLWGDCGYGARPVVFLEDASDETAPLLLRLTSKELRLLRVNGPYSWAWTLNAVEQGGTLEVDD
jgi:hypothetical protein